MKKLYFVVVILLLGFNYINAQKLVHVLDKEVLSDDMILIKNKNESISQKNIIDNTSLNTKESPTWNWIMQYGGSGDDTGKDIVVDASGNIYAVGSFNDSIKYGNEELKSVGLRDMFLIKLNSSFEVIWIKQISGGEFDKIEPSNIILDASNNIIVSGYFNGTINFDDETISSDQNKIFTAKFNNNGEFQWASTGKSSLAVDIDIDEYGVIYSCGDSAIMKYNSTGTELDKIELGVRFSGIVIKNSKIYITGRNPYPNDPWFNFSGLFVAETNLDGEITWVNNGLTYTSKTFTTTAIELDNNDNIFISGRFSSNIFFEDIEYTANDYDNSFIAKFNSTGEIQWFVDTKTYYTTIDDIFIDSNDSILIYGYYNDTLSIGNVGLKDNNNNRYFVKLDNDGNTLWAKNSTYFENAYLKDDVIYSAGSSLGNATFGKIAFDGNLMEEHSSEGNSGYAYSFYQNIDSYKNGDLCFSGNFGRKCYFEDTTLYSETSSVFFGIMDGNREIKWIKTINGENGLYPFTSSIQFDNEENIYLTLDYDGTITLDGNSYAPNNPELSSIRTLKFDKHGNFLWIKSIETKSFLISNSSTDSLNNLIISGYFDDSLLIDDNTIYSNGSSDIFTVKINSNGNTDWYKTYGSTSLDWGRTCDVDPQNNIYTSGYFYKGISFETNEFTVPANQSTHSFVIKYNESGDEIWSKQIAGRTVRVYAMTVDSSSNSYITGFYIDSLYIDDIKIKAITQSAMNSFIAKLDKDGNALWIKSINSKSDGYIWPAYKIDCDLEGNVYTGCMYFEGSIQFHDGTELTSSYSDSYIAKYTKDGDIEWIKQINSSAEEYGIGSIEVFDEDALIVTGYTTGKTQFDSHILSSNSRNGIIALLGEDIYSEAPYAINDTIYTNEDTPVSFTLSDLLNNDYDNDNLKAELSITNIGNATNGELALSTDSVFTPSANLNNNTNEFSFEYTLNDYRNSVKGLVIVMVEPVNDTPVLLTEIKDSSATVGNEFTYQIAANTFNDVDEDDELTFSTKQDDNSALPAWLNFDATTITFTGTPTSQETLNIVVTATDLDGANVSDTFLLTVNETVGINQITDYGFKLSPNPAKNHITISSKIDNYTVEIINLAGQLVYKEQVNNNTNPTIYLSDIMNGTYIVNFIADDIIIKSERLIIAK